MEILAALEVPSESRLLSRPTKHYSKTLLNPTVFSESGPAERKREATKGWTACCGRHITTGKVYSQPALTP